ncbi:hypothetical protein Tco_0285032 [Tanacetum coccineum]
MGLWYSKDTGKSLTAYSDTDHAGCQDTRRSTSGSAQFLGDKLVSWYSKKKKSILILSTEAEYIALSGCNMEMEPDIENMAISEYLEFEAAKEKRLWDDVRSRRSLTNYNEADVDSFHRNKSKTFSYPTWAENMKRMGHEIVQDSIWEQDDDSKEDQEEDGNDGGTFDMWDITVEDVEHIRKFFNVANEIDKIVQPLIPEPIHTTPPNDDYVAPATKLILDKLLEEFGDEILNVTMVDDEADFNPTKDLEELERLLAKEPQSNFMKIQIGEEQSNNIHEEGKRCGFRERVVG